MYTTVEIPKEVVEQKLHEVINKPMVASVATLEDGKPWVRYMVVIPTGDSFSLWSSSSINSRKIEQIKKNPHVHITMGEASTNPNFMGTYVQFAGIAEIKTDKETRHKYWNDMLANYYKGPDDPNYAIIIFKPEMIELWGDRENPFTPYVWKP
jgi:general stress protein 26